MDRKPGIFVPKDLHPIETDVENGITVARYFTREQYGRLAARDGDEANLKTIEEKGCVGVTMSDLDLKGGTFIGHRGVAYDSFALAQAAAKVTKPGHTADIVAIKFWSGQGPPLSEEEEEKALAGRPEPQGPMPAEPGRFLRTDSSGKVDMRDFHQVPRYPAWWDVPLDDPQRIPPGRAEEERRMMPQDDRGGARFDVAHYDPKTDSFWGGTEAGPEGLVVQRTRASVADWKPPTDEDLDDDDLYDRQVFVVIIRNANGEIVQE